MSWTDEVVSSSGIKGPAKLTLEWESEGKQCTMTAKVKDPTILAVGDRERYYDYDKVFYAPKEYYLEFDKLKDDGTVYTVQVHKRFPEVHTIWVPELNAKNIERAATQAGVDKNAPFEAERVEENSSEWLLTFNEGF